MEPATPEVGLQTHTALAEIQVPLERPRVLPLKWLRVVPFERLRASPLQPQQIEHNPADSPALPTWYLSPESLPDNMIIQQTGRESPPPPYADIDLNPFQSTLQTSPKSMTSQVSPPEPGITLKFPTRKRPLHGDHERVPLTPDKIDFSHIRTSEKLKIHRPSKSTPPPKRARLENIVFENRIKTPIEEALKGLSPTQLVNVIKSIVDKHPEIEQELRLDMPKPDLLPLEEKLQYLKSNIFKSLPKSRLYSKTDSLAYSRASIHMLSFKECLVDQGKQLVKSQQWSSVIEYVFLAWSYVKATPVWENRTHNTQRKRCYKALLNFCMTALKKGDLDKDDLIDIHDKLENVLADNDKVHSCLKYIQGLLLEVL